MATPRYMGGDPPAMRNLAGKMDSIAQRLAAMRANLSGELGQVPWHGADANRFRDEWNGDYVPAVGRMVEDLRQAAGAIRGDAAAQVRASDAAGGNGGGSGW